MKRKVIVITNDDGIHAPGLAALARALRRLGRVVVVAPDREQSAISRALSLHRIIRAAPLGRDRVAVSGLPADCVNYALFGLLRRPPDLVISGINHGPNLGDDIAYSGTVAGAAEAAAFGLPAFAISLAIGRRGDYARAARVAVQVARRVLARGLPPRLYLNVNVPDGPRPPRGVKITLVGRRRYDNTLTRRRDPFGKEYCWLGGGQPRWAKQPEADQDAVAANWVSITPLTLDLTAHGFRRELAEWGW